MLNHSALGTNLPPAIAPTIASGISPMRAAVTSPLASDLPLVGRLRWQRLVGLFRLPTTLRGYMAFFASLLVLAFTMTLHIMLSAEIMRLDVQLYTLQAEHARLERYNANIVWEISQHTALDSLHAEAVNEGYVNNVPTEYVQMPIAAIASAAGVDANNLQAGNQQGNGSPNYLQLPGASDPTITDPNAPQPVYQVVVGEPSTQDAASNALNAGQQPVDGAADPATSGTGASSEPRVGALSGRTTEEDASWWSRTMPEWLRFERVGDAIDESLDWVRMRLPSPQWLQQRW
jgi:hypothetical protein